MSLDKVRSKYQQNKESINQKRRLAYQVKKTEILAKNKAYRKKNLEKFKANQKAKYQQNKESINQKRRDEHHDQVHGKNL